MKSRSPKKSIRITEIVSAGAGITAGLEIWRYGTQFILYDRSPDGRFASDVHTWNSAVGLNDTDIEYLKDAKSKDAAS